MALASNLRYYRKISGLTQIELAEKMEISIATLRRWEAGETSPSGAKISELAEIFGVMPEDIVAVGNVEKNPEPSRSSKNSGMLVYESDGTRIELPPTEKGYELFNRLIDDLIKKKS